MKKILGIIAIVAMLMIATISFVSADTPDFQNTDLVDETPSIWFVEFHSTPVADGTGSAAMAGDLAAFESAAAALELDFNQRYAYNRIWNGISISMDASQLTRLESMPEVKAVYPVFDVPIPEVIEGDSELDLYTALAMTGADVVQSELGYDGTGVRVAVMDTGIDYHHPALGGHYNWLARVYTGWDFVGDAYTGANTPVPDDDPDDCNGHGTHVAGIIGLNGDIQGAEVRGVAPGVRFGAYRVFGCDGYTQTDIMLSAMEMALADNMDVLNMSIGSAFTGWPQYPTAVGADALVDAGMVVVASIGNEGDYELYAAGAPGIGNNVIGVASFDNVEVHTLYAEVEGTIFNSPEAIFDVPFAPMTYSGPIPESGTEEIVYVGDTGCIADPAYVNDPNGKIALISRGGDCSFNEKATRAIAAGATGVVIHNNNPGNFGGTLGSVIDGVTPVVSISLEDGLAIMTELMPVWWTWTGEYMQAVSPTGGLISSFSSYGPTAELVIKPDIGAPGGDIWSTMPMEQGGWGSMSGTSMSSPHVAGAAALYIDANRRGFMDMPYEASEVRARLMNSADPAPWNLDPGFGVLDHVYRQGAGMLDIDDAIMSKILITPEKLNLGEASAGPQTRTLTVENTSRFPVYYDLDWVSAVAAEGVMWWVDFWLTNEFVEFSENPLAVPPMGTATVEVTIYPPDDADPTTLYNGYITFTPQVIPTEVGFNLGQTYSVPYMGFLYDYQDDIDPLWNMIDVPVLVDKDWFEVFDGHSFSLREGDYPEVLVHLFHQVRELDIEIVNAQTGRLARRNFSEAYDLDYMPRNAWYNYVFSYPWDGFRIFGDYMIPMKDGAYQLRINALKALGDADNPDHWATWTSPMFFINRHVGP